MKKGHIKAGLPHREYIDKNAIWILNKVKLNLKFFSDI